MPFSTTDIIDNIIRPSFYLMFQDNKTNRYNSNLKERQAEVILYYFSSVREKSKIELLEIQDYLENCFLDDIEVTEGFFICVDEEDLNFSSDAKQGMLTATFKLESLEVIPVEDNSEYADTLEFNLKEEGCSNVNTATN